MTNIERLKQAHAKLREALNVVQSTRDLVDGASTDTLLAIGETFGTIAKAKALVGRDIDQAEGR
jgi:hypothetical protein